MAAATWSGLEARDGSALLSKLKSLCTESEDHCLGAPYNSSSFFYVTKAAAFCASAFISSSVGRITYTSIFWTNCSSLAISYFGLDSSRSSFGLGSPRGSLFFFFGLDGLVYYLASFKEKIRTMRNFSNRRQRSSYSKCAPVILQKYRTFSWASFAFLIAFQTG